MNERNDIAVNNRVSLELPVRFRGIRQLVGSLMVGVTWLGLFVAICVAMVTDPPSAGRSTGAFVIDLTGVIISLAALVRLRWAFTVELEEKTLTYRSLLRTVHYARSDINRIGLEDRYRGAAKISQPFLEMKNGRRVWLADMGQGQLIAPNSTMQADSYIL
jgi:hypothetical protein